MSMTRFNSMHTAPPVHLPAYVNRAEVAAIVPGPNGGSIVVLKGGSAVQLADPPEEVIRQLALAVSNEEQS